MSHKETGRLCQVEAMLKREGAFAQPGIPVPEEVAESSCKDVAVKSVEQAAVPGKHVTAIFNVHLALQGAFDEIADNSADEADKSDANARPQVTGAPRAARTPTAQSTALIMPPYAPSTVFLGLTGLSGVEPNNRPNVYAPTSALTTHSRLMTVATSPVVHPPSTTIPVEASHDGTSLESGIEMFRSLAQKLGR
eukprot:CAMPEP_0206130324 /NCGR_PEP_ID=MMETSP1472-20131121/40378_1 /ASSEMBLY_ACC=CAM_ASM_001108 /TAXON_ID=41880 /ORGANISM="Pycnococcus provasolii, Strain RCC251" /LENGTH=193 /DNA_ID=CAMNT_0053521655 /DNA_START=67 /DNA_END=650 /DNA_ORIENTATION=+